MPSFTGLNTKLLKHPNADNLYFNFIKEQNYFYGALHSEKAYIGVPPVLK